MQIVQIVLDKKLLHAADQAAKRRVPHPNVAFFATLGWDSTPAERLRGSRTLGEVVGRGDHRLTTRWIHPSVSNQRHRLSIHGHDCACHFHHSRCAIGSPAE